MKVGILALQGAVEPHRARLEALGARPVMVRKPEDLVGLEGIILPGGESGTMVHLLHLNHLWEPLRQFVHEKPVLGVCAGAILLARRVSSPAQDSFDALAIAVERNAYGRQRESFVDLLAPTEDWIDREPLEGVFIRAPRITAVEGGVRVLLKHGAEPVMVEYKGVFAATFHPELTASDKVHRRFLERVTGPS